MALNAQMQFFDACRQGDLQLMQASYANDNTLIDTEDARGFTPLIIAVYNNQQHAADFLLRNGAKADSQDASGNTALMGASFKGYKYLAEQLLLAGADVNQRNYQGATALTFAATFGQLEIAEMLLQKGAEIFVRDVRGKSPIDHAVIQENEPMVVLIESYIKSKKVDR